MARPLPKTNAPASVKKYAMRRSVSFDAVGIGGKAMPNGKIARLVGPDRRRNAGGVRVTQTSAPAPRKSAIISDSVMIVIAALARKIAQSNLSLPIVFNVSL